MVPGADDALADAAADQADADEADTPSQPAPIDEIADLTLPAGDPRLAAKAEKELISVQHDLPLTVNDSVLQYLSYFTTTKGRAIVGAWPGTPWPIRTDDSEARCAPRAFLRI